MVQAPLSHDNAEIPILTINVRLQQYSEESNIWTRFRKLLNAWLNFHLAIEMNRTKKGLLPDRSPIFSASEIT